MDDTSETGRHRIDLALENDMVSICPSFESLTVGDFKEASVRLPRPFPKESTAKASAFEALWGIVWLHASILSLGAPEYRLGTQLTPAQPRRTIAAGLRIHTEALLTAGSYAYLR